ncbi:MAG: Pycsar system effector family protein [Saprospiraceae bacterium]
MQETLVAKADTYIQQLLDNQLDEHYIYHNWDYTANAKESALAIGQKANLEATQLTNVILAVLFHRSGNIKTYYDFPAESVKIMQDFLQKENYPAEQIDKIAQCIELLDNENKPADITEEVFLDAINSHLGQKRFAKKAGDLKQEKAHFLNQKEVPQVWLKKQEKKIKEISFQTKAAKKLFKKQAKNNRKKLKAKRKRQEQKIEKAPRPLNGSSEARMMFKTALRNNIDLTNIADNKANIMLSINAIIITLAMPLLAGFIVKQPTLLYPISVLLITCVVTVIFATLATRPIKMDGTLSNADILDPQNNLFFFGNFYKIPLPKYQNYIRQVLKSDQALESSIINDLYYLGVALGHKFHLLRICYLVFMVGITLSVITFGVTLTLLPELPVDLDTLPQILEEIKQQQEELRNSSQNSSNYEDLPPVIQEFKEGQDSLK